MLFSRKNFMKKILILGTFLIVLLGSTVGNQTNAQTMSCSLIPGSVTYFPDMVCALYSCPNGETVQACNLRGVVIR
jgi:hypothetical protein